MAGEVIPKLEQVLEKLENLERYVKAVDEKVSNLQAKVDCFESFKNEKEKKIKELEDGLDFANTERESFKEKFDKLKCEINQLRDEKIYMEVYQRRENLRFFGIKEEADTEEDAREVLVGFLKTAEPDKLFIDGVEKNHLGRIYSLTIQSCIFFLFLPRTVEQNPEC